VRQVTRKMLEISGYTVLEASNSREAIDISEKHQDHIDLLLTDVVMPEIGGLKAAECLVPHRPEMKVLFMSGHTENAIVHHGILDPEIAFIQKPFTVSDLVRKVQEVLNS
jgi:two-component system cell cycle sensor histidine kinase/response regulator CckA